MELDHSVADSIQHVASHLRVLADLMLPGADLREVDQPALAQVLDDLARRLDRALQVVAWSDAHRQQREGQL